MMSLSISRKLALVTALISLLPWAFGQIGQDTVVSITTALRTRDFDKALQLLQPALQQSPKDAQLWTLQGIAFSGNDQEKQALASFRNALKISPDYLPALEGAAQLEYKAGSVAAIPLLQHVLKLRPGDLTSHAMLAVLFSRRRDCSSAVQHFEQSGPLLDSQPGALQQYGVCLVRVKQLGKAISVFSRLVALDPANDETRNYLATLQLMAEHPIDAIETLKPLLQASAPDSKTLQLAASAYEAGGDTPHAVSSLRQAIISDPRNVALYLDFASISMDHQSFPAGIAMINSGLAVQPNAAKLYLARGVLYVQMAQYDQAEADFDKANALDPGQAIGSAALGLEAVQKNSPDEALATVRSKLAKKPDDAYLLFLQAEILNQKGAEVGSREFQTAVASAKKAVSLQPGLGAAHNLLGKLYLQAGQNRESVEESRRALSIDPKDQTAVYHLIQALRKTGDKAELPELLKRLSVLRREATKQEELRNRYKLVEGSAPQDQSAQP
ncbi:MAG: tetratricopeptide repeat protein [Terriglobales bacterium]